VQYYTQRLKHSAKSGKYQDVHLGCLRAEEYHVGRVRLITTDNYPRASRAVAHSTEVVAVE